MGNKALPATGLVLITRPDLDPYIGIDRLLREICRRPTFYTNGMDLGDELGDAKQLWHRFERLARVVLIEARHDHPSPGIRKIDHDADEALIKKLSFIDPDHLSLVPDGQLKFGGGRDRFRKMLSARMGSDLFDGISRIDHGFENLDLLSGDSGAVKAADKLLGLAREHRADYDLDPARFTLPLLSALFCVVES